MISELANLPLDGFTLLTVVIMGCVIGYCLRRPWRQDLCRDELPDCTTGPLKPCPLCKGDCAYVRSSVTFKPEVSARWFIECAQCSARTGRYNALVDAVQYWNYRL